MYYYYYCPGWQVTRLILILICSIIIIVVVVVIDVTSRSSFWPGCQPTSLDLAFVFLQQPNESSPHSLLPEPPHDNVSTDWEWSTSHRLQVKWSYDSLSQGYGPQHWCSSSSSSLVTVSVWERESERRSITFVLINLWYTFIYLNTQNFVSLTMTPLAWWYSVVF